MEGSGAGTVYPWVLGCTKCQAATKVRRPYLHTTTATGASANTPSSLAMDLFLSRSLSVSLSLSFHRARKRRCDTPTHPPFPLLILGEDGAHRQRGEAIEKLPVNFRPVLGEALVLRHTHTHRARGRGRERIEEIESLPGGSACPRNTAVHVLLHSTRPGEVRRCCVVDEGVVKWRKHMCHAKSGTNRRAKNNILSVARCV